MPLVDLLDVRAHAKSARARNAVTSLVESFKSYPDPIVRSSEHDNDTQDPLDPVLESMVRRTLNYSAKCAERHTSSWPTCPCRVHIRKPLTAVGSQTGAQTGGGSEPSPSALSGEALLLVDSMIHSILSPAARHICI